MTPYTPLKIVHHPRHLEAMRLGRPIAPVHLQLTPTNRCAHRCRHCAYRMKGYSSAETFSTTDEIPSDVLLRIVDEAAGMGVKAIQLTGGGEPTMHPAFLECCERIIQRKMELAVVTNGTRWTPQHSRELQQAAWVRFSIDAGCEKTYAAIRRIPLGVFDQVHAAIRDFTAHRPKPGPVIGVGFVVTEENWSEVYQAAVQARDDGVDNLRISAVFQNGGAEYFTSFYEQAAEKCRQAEGLTTDTFSVVNLFGERLHDLELQTPSGPRCGCQQFTTYLAADQQLYRCCVVANSHVGWLADTREDGLRAAWFSPDTQKRLRQFNPRGCPHCMFNEKNAVINYCLNPKPLHVNYP